MITITLFEPQIPPNTGTIARLCAATDCRLHVVGKLGFELTDSRLKRAGLDYWEHVDWTVFDSVDDYIDQCDPEKIHLFTTKVDTSYTEAEYSDGDILIFGSETQGIDEAILARFPDRCRTIPMKNQVKGVRSLNLGVSAGIALYEGLRQLGHLSR